MNKIFDSKDRQAVFEFILSAVKACGKAVSLVQVGSGAVGFHDAHSDLDFVIALDADGSMAEVMDYMRQKISENYDLTYFAQDEARHLQVFLLSNLLEIDIGYGGYEHAAAIKPAFKVLFDRTGVVEEKMIRSRAWMDDQIFGNKQKKDIERAKNSVWAHLMHAAVAIDRGLYFRATGEMDYVRTLYIDLLCDRHRLESTLNREADKLPENEKTEILRTFAAGNSPDALWESLVTLTDLIYREMDEHSLPVSREMLDAYYESIR